MGQVYAERSDATRIYTAVSKLDELPHVLSDSRGLHHTKNGRISVIRKDAGFRCSDGQCRFNVTVVVEYAFFFRSYWLSISRYPDRIS